ncbi:MAG: DUF2520 domain-containing protein [Acidimicrobiia bacterium]
MKILIVGPGRAGGALALAAAAVGHQIVGLVARSPQRWDLPFPMIDHKWPAADLVVVATRDSDITAAASEVAGNHLPASAIHLSGATSVDALAGLTALGWDVGSFHPLQTLPDPLSGAAALSGSWVAVTAGGGLRRRLARLADDLGMTEFDLADSAKPAYHAGAAAASNFLLAGLDLAERLLREAGVPFAAAAPLSAEILENAFAKGPRSALTGPIARGDWETVRAQLEAARKIGLDHQFLLLAEATALTAGVELPAGILER